MNALQILAAWLTQAPAINPPPPDELNPAGQLVIGLGLSGALLIGFVLLVAVLIGAMLAMGWFAHRDVGGHTV